MQFSDLEYVPAALTPELPDVQARAARVAERLAVAGPLRYIGAGASAVVFAFDDVVLKTARLGPPGSRYRKEIERQKRADFFSEAEYIMDAMDRDLPVAGLARIARPAFLREEVVIVKDFIDGKPARNDKWLQDLWQDINNVMDIRWGSIEFKPENFVARRIGDQAILVDAGGAIRRGQNLLDHASAVARGVFDDPDADLRGPTHEESYLRWSLRMDAQDGRIKLEDANRVIAELDARFGTPRRLNPAKPGWKPCKLLADHSRVLEDDALWQSWPLVGRDASMGIETRRCPACHSTQSRPIEGNPGWRRIKLTKGEKETAEWAIDPMEEYWQSQVDDGEEEVMPPLPRVEGDELVLPDHEGVVNDLLYRIEDQLADMSEDEAAHRVKTTGRSRESVMAATAGSLMRPAKNLAEKIRSPAPVSSLASMAMPAGGYDSGRVEIPSNLRRRRRRR